MPGTLRADLDRYIVALDPAGARPRWQLRLVVLFLNPGFHLTMMIRLQALVARLPMIGGVARRVLWYATTRSFGCDVDPHAVFGPGLYLPHPIGIVIGGRTRFGARATILQNVTIGRRGDDAVDPVFGDDVAIHAGAVVIGPLQIGDRARIGANSVVMIDVPADATAVGAPARVTARKAG